MFLSTNGADDWIPTSTGLTSLEVNALAAGGGDTSTLLVETRGVFKSVDGASSWAPAGLAESRITGVAVDPSDDRVA